MQQISKLPVTPRDFADIRNGLALTLDEMSKLLGVDRRTVSRWESAEREIPKPTQMLMILMDTQPEVHRLVQRLSAGLSVGAASSDAPPPKKKVEASPGDRARKLIAASERLRQQQQGMTEREKLVHAVAANQCSGRKTWLKSDAELTDQHLSYAGRQPLGDGPPPSRDELLAAFSMLRKSADLSARIDKGLMGEFDHADHEVWHASDMVEP
jgi:transcriptional regulator with XRE-family HTH domain